MDNLEEKAEMFKREWAEKGGGKVRGQKGWAEDGGGKVSGQIQ